MDARYPQHRRLFDRKTVDVTDPQKLLAASQHLGKKPQEVAYAVSQVGPELDAIAAYLGA